MTDITDDLFIPQAEEEKLHPNFRAIMSAAEAPAREVLISWATGFQDRDGKFIREFQTTFNSSFWELYLFAVLKELDLSVDFTKCAPDFVITEIGRAFSVEAVTASNALGADPEWSTSGLGKAVRQPGMGAIDRTATIRIANSITNKYKKFVNQYQKLAHVSGKPFIIALAPFEQPLHYLQGNSAINRVLFGIDHIEPTETDTKGRPVAAEISTVDEVEKGNGALIPVGLFLDDTMPGVSAIAFSYTATFGKVRALSRSTEDLVQFFTERFNDHGPESRKALTPHTEYAESLTDGLHIIHNPRARNPLPHSVFEGLDVVQHHFDPSIGIPNNDMRDGSLLFRMSWRVGLNNSGDSSAN